MDLGLFHGYGHVSLWSRQICAATNLHIAHICPVHLAGAEGRRADRMSELCEACELIIAHDRRSLSIM